MSFHAQASAKINLFLRIISKRDDGFHELETVFQSVSLFDELDFTESDVDQLSCDDESVPVDGTNLVLRAVKLLRAQESFPRLAIRLRKRIPAGGGLGGGSSDAAATLLAIREAYALQINAAELQSMALSLGSDVPFFLQGGTAYATGRGEVLTAFPAVEALPILLLIPGLHLSTARIFELHAARARYSEPVGLEASRELLSMKEWASARLINDLEPPAFEVAPELSRWKQRMNECGARYSLMSGSGSTIFGVFESDARRVQAMAALSPHVMVVPVEPVPSQAGLPVPNTDERRTQNSER